MEKPGSNNCCSLPLKKTTGKDDEEIEKVAEISMNAGVAAVLAELAGTSVV